MKKLALTIIGIMVTAFVACCVFEASYDLAKIFGISHRWFDALSVCIFISCIFFSPALDKHWREMRARDK